MNLVLSKQHLQPSLFFQFVFANCIVLGYCLNSTQHTYFLDTFNLYLFVKAFREIAVGAEGNLGHDNIIA